MAYMRYYPDMCLQGLRKTMKISVRTVYDYLHSCGKTICECVKKTSLQLLKQFELLHALK
jgi:hypothetical protein